MANTTKIYQLTDDEMNEIYPLTDVHGLVDEGQVVEFDDKPTSGSTGIVKSGGVFDEIVTNGSAFDLTEYMSGATYSGITVALNTMNTNVPSEYKRGGMMLKYVDSTDNKYVHWFNAYSAWTTTVTYWQGFDAEPAAGSRNLVESGAVFKYLAKAKSSTVSPSYTTGTVSKDGVIDTSATNYGYTSPIKLNVGETIYLNEGNAIYHPGNVALLYRSDSSGNFIETLITGDTSYITKKEQYTNATDSDIYVCICASITQLPYYTELLGQAALDSDVKNLLTGVTILTDTDLSLYKDNYYVHFGGVEQSSESFKILSLNAKKGDFISVYSDNSQYVSTISKVVSGSNYYDTVKIGSDVNKKSYYVVNEDCTVLITVNKASTSHPYKVLIIRSQQNNEILSVNKIAYSNVYQFVYPNKYRGWIRYSDGAVMTTTSNIFIYQIPAQGIKKIKVFVTAEDNNPAAISFYSGTPSAANYISGVQMRADRGGGVWYEADVPNNTETICATNHTDYVPDPYLLVDSVSLSVMGIDFDSVEQYLGIGIVGGYMKAANYDGTFQATYTNTSYFPIEDFQKKWRNAALYGIRLNAKQTGTLTIVKATGVKTDNCEMTTIKVFTITKTGWQVLIFDAPVILSDSESIGIGIKTDTAKLVVDSTYGGTNALMTDYLHYTQNTWQLYQQNMLIDVLGIPNNYASVALEKASVLEKTTAFGGNNLFRVGGQFYAHLFTDKIYQSSTNIVIPSESLEDIRVSRRLGFNMIEANVHRTSDNEFVVIHGVSGKFGYEVTDLDGEFTYADTAINSVTLDWIKTNIRYRSDIPRYRTSIPTLEEFLRECKVQGMIVFCQASTSEMVSILDSVMGYGNYIAYNGSRSLTNAPIYNYSELTTKAAILSQCRNAGVPYIYGMANPSYFTNEELTDIVNSLHQEGFMIGAAYTNGAGASELKRLGFDIIASTWNVNDFDNANLCTLCSGNDWNDFAITGATPDSNGITLDNNSQIIDPATTPTSCFLSKAVLHITFSGKLYVKCGSDDDYFTSDGKHEIQFSSYFINTSPTFRIVGHTDGATITNIVFKASKC